MNNIKVVMSGMMLFVITANAMPTAEELKKVEPVVQELMKDDRSALKKGEKTRGEVAEAALGLAAKADSEAAKLLLMKGAFNLYVRAGEFDKAVETLEGLQTAIPDLPPEKVASIIESSLRSVSRKNGGQLYRILDEARLCVRHSNAVAQLEKTVKKNPADLAARQELAEHYAYLGKWNQALEAFAAVEGELGALAKSERDGSADAAKIADFWWSYPTGKADELVKCFHTHAAGFYEKAIVAGILTGLNKIRAERRVAEAKEYGEAFFGSDAKTDGLFCSIDLSAGPEATRYPVSYFSEMPKNGWGDEYKTYKLVLKRVKAGRDPLERYELTKDYYLGVFEVTQKQWELVMGANPSGGKALGDKLPVHGASLKMIRGASENDSTCFIGRLIKRTGCKGISLPTEAQWDYACRAGLRANYYGSSGMTVGRFVPHKFS